MKTIANLKSSVAANLSGLNLNNVEDLYGAFQRAARILIQKADVLEASGRQNFKLYDGVYDYAAPTDIFGGTLFDLRPQGNSRNSWDYVYKQYIEEFDRTKAILPSGYQVTFEWILGVPVMRIADTKAIARNILDLCTSATGWAAAGNASSLALDNSNFYDNGGALRFNLAANGSQGTITKTISSRDLTPYQGLGMVFVAVYIPNASAITSIGIKLGSSSSAYYTGSSTTGFLQAFQVGNWFLVPIDLSTATTVGSPTITAMTYLQVFFNYTSTSALNNVYVGQVFVSLPLPHTLIYGSAALFLPNGGTSALTTITADSDSILLNDAAYTLYELETAREIAFQQGGSLASGVTQELKVRLDTELYPMYRADNPSQELRTIGNWYDD